MDVDIEHCLDDGEEGEYQGEHGDRGQAGHPSWLVKDGFSKIVRFHVYPGLFGITIADKTDCCRHSHLAG